MTFPTTPAAKDEAVIKSVERLLTSAHYQAVVAEVRQRGYRILNQSLRDPNASLANGKLAGYSEIYKILTGKDLFDAAT